MTLSNILDSFCQQRATLHYLKITLLMSIDEVRIEGHTSSTWKDWQRYKRTRISATWGYRRNVPARCWSIVYICQICQDNYEDWVTGKVTAHLIVQPSCR